MFANVITNSLKMMMQVSLHDGFTILFIDETILFIVETVEIKRNF